MGVLLLPEIQIIHKNSLDGTNDICALLVSLAYCSNDSCIMKHVLIMYLRGGVCQV